MITRIYTVLLGVPNTDDRGLVGKVKNHDVRINSISRRSWMIIGGIIFLGAIIGKLSIG